MFIRKLNILINYMKAEYLINSIVYLILYLAVYLIILVDTLQYYKDDINEYINVKYINLSCIFIAYVLLIQVFFQIYSFVKSSLHDVVKLLQVLMMSVLFALFFLILYIGYVLYNKNPVYLLLFGIGLIALPIILFFIYKVIYYFSKPTDTTKSTSDIADLTKRLNKIEFSKKNDIKDNKNDDKSFFSWFSSSDKKQNPSTSSTTSKTIDLEKIKKPTIGERTNSLYNRIKFELTILPNSIKMLLGTEFILIGLYLFNKFGINKLGDLYKPKGIYLAKGSLELSKKHKIGDYESVKNKLHSNVLHSYNYGLSMWLLIKPSGQIDNFVNIFNYGYNPYIEYNEMNNTLRVIMTDDRNNKKIIYETTDFLIQRWNHIVINYYGNYFDVIINGELVGTGKNIAPYLKESSLIIGTNENLKGTIKEVVYFSKPLSKSSIQRISDVFYVNNSNSSVEKDFGIDIFRSGDLGIFSSISKFFTSNSDEIFDKTDKGINDISKTIEYPIT